MALTRDDLAGLVLAELARREAAIAARPAPPAWQEFAAREHAADAEYGPRYSPGWFGDLGATEARRARLLRTVYRLRDAGLLVVTRTEAGRLERVQLSAAGRAAAAALPTSTPAAGAVG